MNALHPHSHLWGGKKRSPRSFLLLSLDHGLPHHRRAALLSLGPCPAPRGSSQNLATQSHVDKLP